MTFDPRKHFDQTQLHFVIGFVILLILVGLGLIGIFYGLPSALMGLMCVGFGVIPILGIFLILKIIDKLLNKINEQ